MWDRTQAERMIKSMTEVLWNELEKIDILRERMGLTYEEARLALEAAHGDVIQALANQEKEWDYHDEGIGGQLWEGIKHQVSRLGQTQVKLKRQDKTVLSISAPLGIAMTYTLWRRPGLRLLSLLGAAGAAMKHYELELDSIDEDEGFEPFHYHAEQTVVYPETNEKQYI